jgi:hypothetical protein
MWPHESSPIGSTQKGKTVLTASLLSRTELADLMS